MGRYEIFANRNKDFQFDVLEYHSMSQKLRIQVRYILSDALGLDNASGRSEIMENFIFIRNLIRRELGIGSLYDSPFFDPIGAAEECEICLMHSEDMDVVLSLIELCILSIERLRDNLRPYKHAFKSMGLVMDMEEAIEELNIRFRKNGFGYEFSNGILIRKDSHYIHEEATKPALHLLQEEGFEGALDEFLKAHDHFRKGNYKETITNASNAFESTMKTIGDIHGFGLTGKENASDLIGALVKNEVIPGYLQTSLQGLATLRNKLGGHGQGKNAVPVSEHFVNYALHLCATNIVMLVESYRTLQK